MRYLQGLIIEYQENLLDKKIILKFLLALLLIPSNAFSNDSLCNISKNSLLKSEEIRGLKILEEVPCFVYNKEQVEKYLVDTIDEKVPKERLENEEILYKAVGLIPKDFQYKQGIIDLYLSQLGGYYDPIEAHYVMAGWMPKGVQAPIAVHELTHALQDQHFNLDDFLDPIALTTDESLAHSALVEGDASFVMYEFMRSLTGEKSLKKEKNVDAIVFQVIAGIAMSEGLRNAPKAMQAMLLFPYTSGLRFAHHLISKGGFSLIDKTYKRVPKTTKEILHPELYLNNFKQKEINKEDFEKYLKKDISKIHHSDVIGEFGISSLLSKTNDPMSSKLAAKWVGDRAILVKENEEKRALWLIYLDNNEEAATLFNLIQNVLKDNIISSFNENEVIGFELK